MKYAVDSTGKVFRLSDTNGSNPLSLETRAKRLNEFIDVFFERGNNKFCFLIQSADAYAKERVLLFTKTQLSSSSQEVRLANELEHHPEIKGEKREYLQSIFTGGNGVSNWYYLGVGGIEFERNMYDGKPINACYIPPIPYSLFIKQLDDELQNYTLLNIGLELNYPKALLEMAFDRNSQFDLEISQALERYKQAYGYDLRDKDSNKANNCIIAITEYKDNCFPVYQQVKNCIKNTFKEAYNIRYKGNCITAQLDSSHSITLYVIQNDPALVVIGGIEYDIESLKNTLTSLELDKSVPLFEETDWFSEKVRPIITTNKKGEEL